MQCTTSVKIAEVVRLAARLQQDGGDEETREYKKEVDSGPSPERRAIYPCSREARMAVVQNYGKNCDPSQSLQFWDVGGQPGWALGWQWSELADLLWWIPRSQHRDLGHPTT